MGVLWASEDEPEEFEWGRLAELQRRNTLCLPHLRSCFPLETLPSTPTAEPLSDEAAARADHIAVYDSDSLLHIGMQHEDDEGADDTLTSLIDSQSLSS